MWERKSQKLFPRHASASGNRRGSGRRSGLSHSGRAGERPGPGGNHRNAEPILRLNRERQITVLISSHILDELSRLATHYGFLDQGRMVKELSAQELESACQKCVRLRISDTKALSQALERVGLEYKIRSHEEADVYGEVNLSQLILDLAKEDCQVFGIQEHNESLESYFMGLVGGGEHE